MKGAKHFIALAIAAGVFYMLGCAGASDQPDVALQTLALPEGAKLQLCMWSCSFDLPSRDLARDVISALLPEDAQLLGTTTEAGRWGASASVAYPQAPGDVADLPAVWPVYAQVGTQHTDEYARWGQWSILAGSEQERLPAPTLLEVRLGEQEGGYRVWLSALRPDRLNPALLHYVPQDCRDGLSIEYQALLSMPGGMNTHQRYNCLAQLLGESAQLEYEDEHLTVMALPGVVQCALRTLGQTSQLIAGWPVIQGGY